MLDGFLARLATGNARLCALVYKGFTKPIGIISLISETPFGFWQAVHQKAQRQYNRNRSIVTAVTEP